MYLKSLILSVLLVLGSTYLFKRKNKFCLEDFYVLGVILFFFLYPILDLLNKKYDNDTLVFFYTISYIIFAVIGVVSLNRIGPFYWIKRFSTIKMFWCKVLLVRTSTIVFLFIVIASLIGYYFFSYGLIFRVIDEDMSAVVNTYRQVLNTVILPICFMLTLITSFKIFFRREESLSKFSYCILAILLVVISIYFVFYGRRELILQVFLIGIVWSLSRQNNFITLKSVFNIILICCFAFVGSNLFQNLRWEIMTFHIDQEFNIDKSWNQLLFDFESTEKNVEERSSSLPILSSAIEKVLENETSLSGDILLTGFLNSIPAIIYPNKEYVEEDYLLSEKLRIPFIDYSTNDYLIFLVDFGFWSLIILPMFLSFYFLLSHSVLYFLRENTILYMLTFTHILLVLFNGERSISAYFVSLRFLLIIILVSKILPYKFKEYFKL